MLQEAAIPLPTVGLFFTKKSSVSYWKSSKMSTAGIPEIPRGRWGHNQPTSSSLFTSFCSLSLMLFVSLLYERRLSSIVNRKCPSENTYLHSFLYKHTSLFTATWIIFVFVIKANVVYKQRYILETGCLGFINLYSAAFIVLMSVLFWQCHMRKRIFFLFGFWANCLRDVRSVYVHDACLT